MVKPSEILTFWFGSLPHAQFYPQDRAHLWFKQQAETDQLISDSFGESLIAANNGGLKEWESSVRDRLALVILLDQFSRNIYRGSKMAFAGDARALALVEDALDKGWDLELALIERVFFYLPLEHTEDLAVQDRCLSVFSQLLVDADEGFKNHAQSFLNFAQKHKEVILEFGRFPYRNKALGRASSPQEVAYTAKPGHF